MFSINAMQALSLVDLIKFYPPKKVAIFPPFSGGGNEKQFPILNPIFCIMVTSRRMQTF